MLLAQLRRGPQGDLVGRLDLLAAAQRDQLTIGVALDHLNPFAFGAQTLEHRYRLRARSDVPGDHDEVRLAN
ncbi:hypothetical protein GCM10009826_46000 [Humibacillus xanthopallidus]